MPHTLTKQTIESKLQQAFQPQQLDVIDESHKHAGHASSQQHGGGNFKVVITCSQLNALPRLARQRAVQEVLEEEFKTQKIHALSVKFKKEG